MDTNNQITKWVEECNNWKEELKPYWTAIDKNQEMYEFFKREHSETQSQVSLNTPFSIVESIVARANDIGINITVQAYGEKDLQPLESWISAVLEHALFDSDVAQFHGTFRKARERFLRDYLIKGNAIATVEWCKKKSAGETIANNPYVRVRDYKSVIFNPANNLCSSDVYYIESNVKYSDLIKNEYNKKSGKGKYKNLAEIKKLANAKQIEIDDESYYSDGKKIKKKAEPIRIIERYEGTKYAVIADDKVCIYEENDPFKVGGHNIITSMNYVVGNRPYAYGEIDAIYKTVQAQDTVVNQSLDMVNRHLRPRVLVDQASGIDLDQIIDLIENGGAMYGKPDMVGAMESQVPPSQAFTSVETLQQAIERAARYSPYASGMTSQSSDKTQGTMGGIRSLQVASEPNFQIKLDSLEEDFMRPVAKLYLKMIANLMGKDDIKYGLLQGKTSNWVMANKAVLQGKPTLMNLVQIGYLSEEDAQGYMSYQDPTTGEIVPIPDADKALVFDIDWFVNVKLDNRSALDKGQEVDKKIEWIKFSREIGVQFSPEKTATEVGREIGIDDPEGLYLTEEEKEQQMQQMQQQQEAQKQAKKEEMQFAAQADIQKEQIRGENNIKRERSKVGSFQT